MKKVSLLCGALFVAVCLVHAFAACSGNGRRDRKTKPYSPIEGDTVDVIIGEHKRYTVGEALDEAFGDGKSQDSLHREVRRAIEKKYKRMGDSLQTKLLKGERIH